VSNPLDTERIQFFLRHRDDIREWAAIEREVISGTRELLAGLQPVIEERIVAIDPSAEVVRHDGGRYERILVRRQAWPVGIGVTLEWESSVDPFGGTLPKWGIFFVNGDLALRPARSAMAAAATAAPWVKAQGYKPSDSVWPIVRFVPKSSTWWQDPEAWLAPIADAMVVLWPLAAPIIDGGLEWT
jgi:hypothetical protein